MLEIVMEGAVQVLASALLMLIGVLGTWLTLKLGKKQELASINAAQQEVIRLTYLTVEELQQTLVAGLKASHADGKLTREEIIDLGKKLLEGTMAKMSAPTEKLLSAASVDITALIQGAGEAWLAKLKAGTPTE